MTSFVHIDYPSEHPGVQRAEAVYAAAGRFRKGYSSTKGLAALLLAAVVAAFLVVADQLIDTWADGHLLAGWVALWAVGFAVLGLFAGTARRVAVRTVAALDAWSARVAQQRADDRFWATAQHDPRVMAELQAALQRQVPEQIDPDADLEPAHIRRGKALA